MALCYSSPRTLIQKILVKSNGCVAMVDDHLLLSPRILRCGKISWRTCPNPASWPYLHQDAVWRWGHRKRVEEPLGTPMHTVPSRGKVKLLEGKLEHRGHVRRTSELRRTTRLAPYRPRAHSYDKFHFILPSFIFWVFFGGPHHAACGILVPRPGIEPRPSAVKARSPNHWNTREFPQVCFK